MKELPKIELHLHLEGGAPPAFIRGLAAEKHVDLSRIFDERGHYAYKGFVNFLRVYEAATSVLQTPRDFARLSRAVLEESAAHGVVYTEMFLSPDFCGGGDLSAWREYLAAIEEAAAEAERDIGITMRGIITCIRHEGPEQSRPVAICAAETAGPFIRGFGIAGDESTGHPRDFTWAFDCAREAGLHLTAHAGEWGGPQSVRAALEHLKPARIGHGVHSIDDPALIDTLAEAGIVLEVCPGSNVSLGAYPSLPKHPVQALRDRGVKVTVSTDDPPFFHTTMTSEFEGLAGAFGWGEDDFAEVTNTALEAAFCDGATRETIRTKLGDTVP